MRIPSGTTDQSLYFVAVDATDFTTRETGLSSFTVVRSRDGGADTTYTTPTVTEIDNSTMPGVYALLLDEDMTIGSGNQSEEVALHITHAGMAPVTRTFELYQPTINEVVEGSYTMRELLRGWTAALLGKASGLGTSTAVYRNTDDDVDVITATVDIDGNRSAVTLDLTDTP